MPLQKLLVFIFLLFQLHSNAQSRLGWIDSHLAKNPDTLYYPFNEEGLQLVIITNYDRWFREGVLYDQMYPRSGSWFMDNGPAPRNTYLWRSKNGEIIKQFHMQSGNELHLRNTEYSNRKDFLTVGFEISDYQELDGYFRFYSENNKMGLIDLKGEIVLSADFDYIRKFQNRLSTSNRILVEKDGKVGMLYPDLKEVFPPIYTGVPEHNVVDRYLKMGKDGKYGLIDDRGKVLIDFVYDEIRPIHDSLYMALVYKDSSELQKIRMENHWNWGYKTKDCIVFDNHFRVITELRDYEYINYWGISQLIVKKDKYFGVLNTKGEVVIPLEYDHVSGYEGYYHVSKNNRVGLITTDGKRVLPAEFTHLEVYGKAIYVIQNELIGVYNDQFQLIAKPQFKNRYWKKGRFLLIRPDGSEGFVDNTAKEGCYYQSPEGEIQKL